VGGDAISFAAVFITGMILARVISKVDMATYRQVVYIGMLVVSVCELGISGTLYRYSQVFKGEARNAFYFGVFCATTVLGMVGSLGIFVLASPLANLFGNPDLHRALSIAAFYPLVTMPFMLVRPMIICAGKPLKATLLETLFAIATASALIVPLLEGYDLLKSLIVWMLINACRLPLVIWYLNRELQGCWFRWDESVLREVWGYIWPLQVSRLPGLAMVYFDKICTSVFLTRESFAAYSLGARELPFLNRIPFSLSSVTIPRMVNCFQLGRMDEICAIWRKACFTTGVVTFLPAAFCVWHAQSIVRVLFTSRYDESAIPFAAFSAITFLRVVDYGSLAKAVGDSRIILRGAVLAASIGIPMSFMMTWLWGVRGISFSLLLCCGLLSIYYLYRYSRLLRRSVSQFYPYGQLGYLCGLSFVCVIGPDLALGNFLNTDSQIGGLSLALGLGIKLASSGAAYLVLLLVAVRLNLDIVRNVLPDSLNSRFALHLRKGKGAKMPADVHLKL